MRRLAVLLPLLLCACAAPPPSAGDAPAAASSVSSVATASSVASPFGGVSQRLMAYPPERSLAQLSTMRLQGTGLTLDRVLDDNAAYVRYAITYESNGVKITGVLNIPKGAGPFPLLVLNHGYIDPAVYTQGRGLKREQDSLARQGFAVLHTDYRGHAGGDPNPDDSKVYDAGLGYSMDSANAVLAVRAAGLDRVDASRVGMLGHSMGGGVTLNLLTSRPDVLDAAVLYAPVHADAWQNFLRWRDRSKRDPDTRAVLGSREENPEAWDAMSASSRLAEIASPVLVFHGTADKDVPYEWSTDLLAQLEERGKDVELVTYPGEGHEFGPQWSDFMRRTAAFFHAQLDPPKN